MSIIPKKTKHKKVQKGNLPTQHLSKNREIINGTFALKAADFAILSSAQIESCRKLIAKKIKKKGRIWSRIFPHTPITRKPVEIRMGKGKGSVDHWVCKIKPGCLLYEITGIPLSQAQEILKEGSKKLPMNTKIINKCNY